MQILIAIQVIKTNIINLIKIRVLTRLASNLCKYHILLIKLRMDSIVITANNKFIHISNLWYLTKYNQLIKVNNKIILVL